MAKVRFLQSVALLSSPKTYGLNDELVIENEQLVDILVKQGLVDVLINEENEQKPAKKAPKRAPKRAQKEVNEDA